VAVIIAVLCLFPLGIEEQKQVVALYPKVKNAVAFIDGGSGVVISPDGLLLTCNHVVAARLPTWRLYLSGGKRYEAEVLGRQVENDIALLKIRGEGPFPYLPIAARGTVHVGDIVLALGNPFLLGSDTPRFLPVPPEFEPSMTCGIVSGLGRSGRLTGDIIECDAALNPGNSGGPIVNLQGEIVALAGRIANRFGVRANSGAGYGPSCEVIHRFLPALLKAGGREVFAGDLPGLELAEDAGAVVVRKVAPDSSAEKAGLRPDDQIISAGDFTVRSPQRFRSALASYPAGAVITLWVKRGKKDLMLRVRLEGSSAEVGFLGVRVRPSKDGLVVDGVVDPAKSAGVKAGDLLVAFENTPVGSAEELALLLTVSPAGDTVTVTVKRKGKELRIKVKLAAVRRFLQGKPYY